jgi:hypothetical protein
MAKSDQFYRVVTMELKQAIGLKQGKPTLEEVLNRLAARGYLAVHFVDHDGAVTAICERHIEVPKEEAPNGSNVPPVIPATEDSDDERHGAHLESLPQPEIVPRSAG